MKKTSLIILALAISTCLWGCGKNQTSSEELAQEPLSMETISTMNATETGAAPGIKPEAVTAAPAAVTQAEPKLEPLPPAGPYEPTKIEIQTALKNAGYYTGSIDGKIGTKTKVAIEEFQKANSLNADGKVGPKTWAVLSSYLNAVVGKAPKKATDKKR
jgi:peptidoglycan hydrolase-like protein with peptidoglycan-binding domain